MHLTNFASKAPDYLLGNRLSDEQRVVASRIFKHHGLFSALMDSQLERLIAVLTRVELQAGGFLFQQHDAAEQMFLLETGQVKLCAISGGGRESVLELVMPGNTIGEHMMYMPDKTHSVVAQAIHDSTLYAVPRYIFPTLQKENVDFCHGFLKALSINLNERINEMVCLTQEKANCRVARFLKSLMPANASNGHVIYLITPKHVIASRLSMKPETLSRLMSEMAQQGIIDVKGRRIVVNDIAGLHSYL
ncbi:MAG: Crp/Fnr family transcriptional regulator [Motiliproteus sp.]